MSWKASPPQGESGELSIIGGLSPRFAPPQGMQTENIPPILGAEMAYENLDIMTYEDATIQGYEE